MIRTHEKGYNRVPHICDCGSHGFVGVTRGGVALFDCALIDAVADGNWHRTSGCPSYAACKNGAHEVRMQSLVLPARVGQFIDHINGDGLDNRSANLRHASFSQNVANSRVQRNPRKTSRFKGVSWDRRQGTWEVNCMSKGVRRRAVVKTSEIEAALLYDAFAVELFGPFARTNRMLGLITEEAA